MDWYLWPGVVVGVVGYLMNAYKLFFCGCRVEEVIERGLLTYTWGSAVNEAGQLTHRREVRDSVRVLGVLCPPVAFVVGWV